MTRTAKYLAASFLIACTAFAAPPRETVLTSVRTAAPAPTAPGCADFLALMGKKPVRARYIGCAYLPGQQGKPLRAAYRVEGRFAGITEAYLVKTAGLNRLRR